jgi:hypothetical protein
VYTNHRHVFNEFFEVVEGHDNSEVGAFDNSKVWAYGKSVVRADDNLRVEAYVSSQVTSLKDEERKSVE